MIQYPEHFDLSEFIVSSTARQKSLQNEPTWKIVEHLLELCTFLEDIRAGWAKLYPKNPGITITSGYRCPALNTAVGGVSNSDHQWGNACDMVPANGKFDEFVNFLKKFLPVYEKGWNQCIIESKGRSKWVHFSNYGRTGGQKRQLFSMTVK